MAFQPATVLKGHFLCHNFLFFALFLSFFRFFCMVY